MQLSVVRNLEDAKQELLKECNRRAYLNGTYFVPNLNESSLDGTIVAIVNYAR